MSEPVNDRHVLKIGANTRVVEIALNPVGCVSAIKLDGELVKNCRSVTFHAAVGEATTITLEIINVAVLVEGGVIGSDVKVVDVTPIDAAAHKYALMRMAEAEADDDDDDDAEESSH